MPVSISQHLGIGHAAFDQTGALDAILDVDSKFFIDPHLLSSSDAPELRQARRKLTERFTQVLKLLEHSTGQGDAFWRRAADLLSFREIKGLCIGYSSKGTSGSGIGSKLTSQLLATAKVIVDAGIKDPEIFELMGLLEPGIGADRISDMVARIIYDELLAYSERIFVSLGVSTLEFRYGSQTYRTVRNPFNNAPIVLVPMDVLRNLPIAAGWDDIDFVVGFNSELRSRVNSLIGGIWRRGRRLPKSVRKEILLANPELLREILAAYRALPAERYDFDKDPAGQIAWHEATRNVAVEFPLTLSLPSKPSAEDVLVTVVRIANQYKDLIENNQLSKLLYDDAGKPKHEEAAQLLFYGVANSYCKANDLDLTREANAGRGPVDFKVSAGFESRVIAETKLSTNSQLLHGFHTQIGEYQKAETAAYSVFIVIDVGGPRPRINRLKQMISRYEQEGKQVPEVIFVDARPKAPASKYRGEIP